MLILILKGYFLFGRGIWPRDVLKKVSRVLSRVEASETPKRRCFARIRFACVNVLLETGYVIRLVHVRVYGRDVHPS